MTEDVAQLCPFPVWTHQADFPGSVLPSWATPKHGNCFSSNPNKGQTWCRPLGAPSERDFGSSAAVGCKSQRTPCALVSAFPSCSGCAVTSLRETLIFLAPRTCIPHSGAPQMHTGSCSPFPWLTVLSVLISRAGLSDLQTHWCGDVLCASWLHFKTQKCLINLSLLWLVSFSHGGFFNNFQCSFSSCLHKSDIEKFLLFKHAGLCRETDFPDWWDYWMFCSGFFFLMKRQSP